MAIICLIVFFALAIFIKLKMPMWKGKYSEKLVHKKMLQLPDEYTIFNDFLFISLKSFALNSGLYWDISEIVVFKNPLSFNSINIS